MLSLFARMNRRSVALPDLPAVHLEEIILDTMRTERNCGIQIKFLRNLPRPIIMAIRESPRVLEELRETTYKCTRHLLITMQALANTMDVLFLCRRMRDEHPNGAIITALIANLTDSLAARATWTTLEELEAACRLIAQSRQQARNFFTAPFRSECALLMLEMKCPIGIDDTNVMDVMEQIRNLSGPVTPFVGATFPDGTPVVNFGTQAYHIRHQRVMDMYNRLERDFPAVGGHDECLSRPRDVDMMDIFRNRGSSEAMEVYDRILRYRNMSIHFYMWRYSQWRVAVERRIAIMRSTKSSLASMLLKIQEFVAWYI